MTSKRKLSSLERFHYHRSRLNLHSCFYVGIQLNELPDKQLICQALKKTIADHPQLHQNIAIDPEDGKPYIRDISSALKFEDVAEYVSDTYSEDSINQIFRTRNFPYNVDKPLWRLLILENDKELLLLLDHVLFDGMSAVEFWKSFMKFLPNEAGDSNGYLWTPNEWPTVQESCHPYERWPNTWSLTLTAPLVGLLFKLAPGAVVAAGKDQIRFKNYQFPSGLLVEDGSTGSSGYITRNDNRQTTLKIEPDILGDLLLECKRHGVTLTSFLAALLAVSMDKYVEPSSYTGSHLKIEVPMNTREACSKVLNISKSSMRMGNFIAVAELRYDLCSADDVWGAAKKFCQDLRSQTTTNVISTVNNVRLLDYADARQFVEEKVKTVNPSVTLELTNLGAQDFTQDTPNNRFLVKNAVFNQPQSISSIFSCSTITTPEGGLSCSLSYPKDINESVKPCFDKVKEFLDERCFKQ